MTLTREEELQLVALARAGDREAMAALWDAFRGLTWGLARKMARKGVEADDLAQEGFLGMAKAVRAFDPSRGTRFATLAWLCIRREIGSHLRSRGGQPLPQGPPDGPARAEELLGELAAEDDSSVGMRAEEVREAVRTLPRRERQTVELFYGLEDGRSLSVIEIGEVLGISASGVSQRLGKARRQLRETCRCPVVA